MTSVGQGVKVTRTRYHHGQLREALVATGLELARTGGPSAVVLREAARRLEVSPAAGYRHFSDREELLLAVRREALGALGLRMLDAARAADPLARFRGLGEGYVRFALEEPGLFRTTAAPGVLVRPGQAPEGRDPFRLLSAALDDLVHAGRLSAGRRAGADAVALSAVHGLAVLLLDGLLPQADAEALLARTLDAVAFGLLPAGPPPC